MFDLRDQAVNTDLATVDVLEARAMHRKTFCVAQSNSRFPWMGDIPPLWTWRVGTLGSFDVLTRLPLDEVVATEGDHEWAMNHWTTKNYIRWLEVGYQAPPVSVVRNVAMGCLASQNRRRVLAAKHLGHKTILAWFSETDPDGRATWRLPKVHYKDVPDGMLFWSLEERGDIEYHKGNLEHFDPWTWVYVPVGELEDLDGR